MENIQQSKMTGSQSDKTLQLREALQQLRNKPLTLKKIMANFLNSLRVMFSWDNAQDSQQ